MQNESLIVAQASRLWQTDVSPVFNTPESCGMYRILSAVQLSLSTFFVCRSDIRNRNTLMAVMDSSLRTKRSGIRPCHVTLKVIVSRIDKTI
jgi:hypothetical protein